MTDEELYRAATGDNLPGAALGMPVYCEGNLTEGDVQAFLTERGGPGTAAGVPMRYQMEDGQDHPGDKVFRVPVPLPDGCYLVLSFTMGYDSEDPVEAWKPFWKKLEGPVTLGELEAG